MANKKADERVDVNFESHPPIEEDLKGISALLRQTLLQFVDCHSLARHLIQQKDLTQVIAQEEPEEENTGEDDEPDDDIYGVTSIVDLSLNDKTRDESLECRRQLLKFIKDKCSKFEELIENAKTNDHVRVGFVVNERYMNLPPQLSLPTLKTMTQSIDSAGYTHLVFISKILLKARNTETKLPSKRTKTGHSSTSEAEPIVYVNPEEEIISEEADHFVDLDVSSHCDENASWSFSSDIKYIPHRRILIMDFKKWPSTMKKLEKELEQ